MTYKIVSDSSSNVITMADAHYVSVPMKVRGDKEYIGQWRTAKTVFTTPADMALNTNWDLGIVVDGTGSEEAVIDNLSLNLYNSGVEAESISLNKTSMTLIPDAPVRCRCMPTRWMAIPTR